jgi:hypothetical protein
MTCVAPGPVTRRRQHNYHSVVKPPHPGAQTDLFRLGEGDDFGSAFLYLRRRRPGQAWYGEVASRRHQVAEGRIERTIPFRISAEEQAEIERMRANIALSE